ncbi:hypothetical protein [Luteolibacter sp. Populi]|uniref:lectin-like domain-containing protein n=1 Tax=Luteolibacter sp. Populi TaxID=3230487 RepID=UPI003466A0F6
MIALAGEAAAASKTYQYFRFEPKAMQNGSTQIQLSEFTFSFNGVLLNINNRNTTGVNTVAATAASGAQDPNANEGPNRTLDGKPLTTGSTDTTKWFSDAALTQPLDISFTAGPVTVDAYSFATANDSAGNARTPVTWFLYGRNSTSAPWEVIDYRANQTMIIANNTYQATYTMPESVPPVVNFFRVQNTTAAGTAAIVRNDDVNGVKLEWDTALGDTNGTTIAPVPGAVAQTGLATLDPPDSATTLLTISASRALPTPVAATATARVRSVIGGVSNFRYIRFKATKLRSGLATGLIQLNEFGFRNGANPVAVTEVTSPGADNGDGEIPSELTDGDLLAGKWLDRNNAAVIFDLGDPALPGADDNSVTHYYFHTANDDPNRDPLQWILEGSNDQLAWTIIENVDFDYPTPVARFVGSRNIPLPGASLSPLIDLFTGDATTLYEGTPLTLTWATRAVDNVTIDQGIGTVLASDTVSVTPPLGSTTYTLTANSPGNLASSTRTFTVNVLAGTTATTVNYADFSNAANDFSFSGPASIVDGSLFITPEIGGQLSSAWFRTKQNVAGGFEATFGLSMTHTPNGVPPADGVAFVIQNHPQGTSAPTTGESGVSSKALNIAFKTFGFDAANASRIQVLNGTQEVRIISASTVPGITYPKLPDLAYPTLAGPPGSPPYRVRIVYVPGTEETDSLLDVYLNDVAVIEDAVVDLEDIGAVDANGKAYIGFTGRTGGNSQRSLITDWHMAYGDFSALPPFGIVKSFRNTLGGTNTWDLVWNSDPDRSYVIQSSDNLVEWDDEASFVGEPGQIGLKVPIDFATESRRFYRVVEDEEE